jgi:hypothetical protein
MDGKVFVFCLNIQHPCTQKFKKWNNNFEKKKQESAE